MEPFNIFKWQIDPEYKGEVLERIKEDTEFADSIYGILTSVGQELGLPFEMVKPKIRPKVWVDKGHNTWNTNKGWSV